METDKTYWFHKKGIFELEGPLEGTNMGRNAGKMFLTRLLFHEDGTPVDEQHDIQDAVHTQSHITALEEAIKYFTGSDYEEDKIAYSSCSLSKEE